nr:hypothetical protein [Clostridia bacterium]
MKIMSPFLPVEVTTEGLNHNVKVLGRNYTLGADSMPSSILVNGNELLAAPMRIVMGEDGQQTVWDTDYPNNESESFIHKRNDEGVIICGTMASERFIVNTCFRIEYDGCMVVDLKVMPKGHTVPQGFGLEKRAQLNYKLDYMWLEIPLKKEFIKMYNISPNHDMYLEDGTTVPRSLTSYGGLMPDKSASLRFMPTVWLGSEEAGLGFFTENDRCWQVADETKAYEIIQTEDEVILRVHLLDSHPIPWTEDPLMANYKYQAIGYRFGIQTTPVKPFPKQPYPIHGLHIDCFIKTKGNYRDFFDQNDRFDRLVEKGVDILILHEKWNKSQNSFEISEYTAEQIKYIVSQCHKRGIKVLTYFGYETSSIHPDFYDLGEKITTKTASGKKNGGWFRYPYQRAYVCCYASEWADRFIEGITNIIDTYHIDGVYLDGTAHAWYCCNTEHGCGWYDYDGNLKGSYSILATREMFKRLYEVVQSRGGIINVHSSGYSKFYALPFIHLCWHGEDLQSSYMKGNMNVMPIDTFRSAYTGRAMGVPVELIGYENRPIWTFENALALGGIHGILPRPNDIEHPLDLMADIWKIYDAFPILSSEFVPYWNTPVKVSDDRIKVTYYRYTAYDGSTQLLAFCANITNEPVTGVTIEFAEEHSKVIDAAHGNAVCDGTYDFEKLDYKILFVK